MTDLGTAGEGGLLELKDEPDAAVSEHGPAALSVEPAVEPSVAPRDLEAPLLLLEEVPVSVAAAVAAAPRSWYRAALAPLTDSDCMLKPGDRDLIARAVCLLFLAASAFTALVSLFRGAPAVDAPECVGLTLGALWHGMFPKFLGGEGDVLGTARRAWLCADAYQRKSPEFVLVAYASTYIGLQAFAIPGPLLLSIIAGALWGVWRAQAVIAVCATGGATVCYLLSHWLARPLLERLIPGSLAETRQKIDSHRDNLLYYLLFLRLTPLVPNWLVNVSCPIVNVPLWVFVTATGLGLLPANYAHALTGSTLASLDLTSTAPVRDNWRSFLTLAVLPVAVLVPVLLKRRYMPREALPLKSHSR